MIELHQKQESNNTLKLYLVGDWKQSVAPKIHSLLSAVSVENVRSIYCNAGQSSFLDISAAWLIVKQTRRWEQAGIQVYFEHFPEEYFAYFNVVPQQGAANQALAKPPMSIHLLRSNIREKISYIGCQLLDIFIQAKSAITFLGQTLVVTGRGLIHFRQLRIPSIFHHVFSTGLQAIPIIVLLACLISIVITYQGGSELKDLGASIYTVDLVAVSILRELGVLLTAIMVAGRSSSAFAAEIGIMKTNQEIDALKVAGLNPYEILVVPRMIALLIALPLLTLLADILSLAVAAVISSWSLGITIDQFATRLQQNISISTFFAGIIKAPFFAVIIAITGTWNGMLVDGSAESLGKHTTAAVVQAIFIVLFLDAVFSMFYYSIGF